MSFSQKTVQGLTKYLADTDVDPHQLRMHISELAPGTRSHEAHTHAGVEAFYILKGHGTIEVAGEKHSLGPNEVILLDAGKPHGISNTGTTVMRYLVIIVGN